MTLFYSIYSFFLKFLDHHRNRIATFLLSLIFVVCLSVLFQPGFPDPIVFFVCMLVCTLLFSIDHFHSSSYQELFSHKLSQEFLEELALDSFNSSFTEELVVSGSLRFSDENRFLGFELTWLNESNVFEAVFLENLNSLSLHKCVSDLLKKLYKLNIKHKKKVVLLVHENGSGNVLSFHRLLSNYHRYLGIENLYISKDYVLELQDLKILNTFAIFPTSLKNFLLLTYLGQCQSIKTLDVLDCNFNLLLYSSFLSYRKYIFSRFHFDILKCSNLGDIVNNILSIKENCLLNDFRHCLVNKNLIQYLDEFHSIYENFADNKNTHLDFLLIFFLFKINK